METKAIMSIAAILAAFGTGFWLADTLAAKEALDERMERLQAEKVVREDMDRRVNLIDAEHFKELSNAKSENDKLRRDLASGTKRVRVAVSQCESAGSSSVDNAAATAELDEKTAADLAGISADGDEAIRQLTALQEWAKTVAGSTVKGGDPVSHTQ